MATECGSKWFQWTSANSHLTYTKSATSFSTTTITSQSYSYSTSVVQEDQARITFEYASPVGKPITTTTSVSTFYSMEQIVTRWTSPPPTCTPSAWLRCTKGPNCRACTVQGGTVEVLFWPQNKGAGGNTIAKQSTNRTVAVRNEELQPLVTAMFGTHTLTSPSVYISFQTAYALNDCGHTVGKARPGALLAMDPESLFTMRAGFDYFELTSGSTQTTFYESASFNYEDFNGPVPPSVYTHQPSCLASGCYTIYPDYHPQLALPPQVRGMDPEWESCALDWRGSWDPPIALSRAESIAGPTTLVEPTHTEPASPHPTIDSPAKMTASSDMAEAPESTSSGQSLPKDQQSAGSESTTGRMFTYSPASPIHDPSLPNTHADTSTAPLVQITTIVQVDPQPLPSQVGSGLSSTAVSGFDQLADGNDHGTDSDPDPSSAAVISPSNASQGGTNAATSTPQPTPPRNSQPPLPTTLLPNGEPVTINNTIYTATSSSDLLILSALPPNTPPHSPTNAYEVLSAALSSATAILITLTPDSSDSIVMIGSQTLHLGSGAQTTSPQQDETSTPGNRTRTSTVTRLQSLPSVEAGGGVGGALPSVTSESSGAGVEGGGEGESIGTDDASGAGRVEGKLWFAVFWTWVLGLGFGFG